MGRRNKRIKRRKKERKALGQELNQLIKDGLPLDDFFKKISNWKYEDKDARISIHDNRIDLLVSDDCEEIPSIAYNIKTLASLDLSNSKIQTLTNIESFLHLESLYLDYMIISEIPESIYKLKKLKFLLIENCENILNIPVLPVNIEELYISDIPIEELPQNLYELKKLKKLELSYLTINELSESIENFKYLESLNLSDCENFESLPNNIGNLTFLDQLNLSHTNLLELPESICNLKRLTSLNLSSTRLLELPKDIGNLGNLRILYIDDTKIIELPKSVTKLKKLEKLYVPKGMVIPFTLKEMVKSGQLEIVVD